jgi:signal recognition particle subunit SRP54
VVSLVERAAATIDAAQAQKVAAKMQKGEFDLDDLADQLRQMQKLGGMSSILGMLPGVGKMKKQIDAAGLDDKMFKQQVAIISSMTKQERRSPKILAASRKKRIAAGSGTQVQDVNKLLKMHRQMADMMKMVSKGKGGLGKLFGLGGGMPEMTPEMIEAAKSGKMPGMPSGGMGGMPGLPSGMRGLPGMPGGFPGLPGKKK